MSVWRWWGAGRRSHVRRPHHKPPAGMREHSISSFLDIGLWWRERRHAVQGKYHGSWRGGPHVVCVSGGPDLEGLTPGFTKAHVPEEPERAADEG